MPPKTTKGRSRSARSKSTDKRTPKSKSRSVSRSRTRVKPEKSQSDTKRVRSKSKSPPASPVKIVKTATTRTTTSKQSESSSMCKFCPTVPCLPLTKFGSYFVPIVGILAPIFVFLLNCFFHETTNWGPTKKLYHANIPTDIWRYFDWKIHLAVYLTVIKMGLITKYVKLGKKVSQVVGGKRHEYCNNLWLVLISVVVPLAALHYRGDVKVTSKILDSIPSIFTAHFMLLLCDSSICLKKSWSKTRANRNFLHDFYDGKETRPAILGYDVKLFARRFGICTLFCYVAVLMLSQYEAKGHVSPGLALVFATLSVRTLDAILFEHKQLPFYTFHYETCGYKHLSQGYIAFPFLYSLSATICYYHPEIGASPGMVCNGCEMGIAALLFLSGYFIQRLADNQKYGFRMEPHADAYKGMECVASSTGKRLLAGGWFGLVRFPNYMGALLMMAGWLLPLSVSYPKWGALLGLFALIQLLVRVHVVEQHMIAKHGSAYNKYKALVPKRLIPGVF